VTRNVFTRLALLIAAFVMIGSPVGARIVNNTIGDTGALIGHGQVVRATVFLGCTAGQQVQFTLTLTQDGASGTGHGATVCTGDPEAYEVTVPADGGDPFTPGFAAACATAVNYRRGVVVDTREWCRAAGVTLTE
jgi:hypothetical protein